MRIAIVFGAVVLATACQQSSDARRGESCTQLPLQAACGNDDECCSYACQGQICCAATFDECTSDAQCCTNRCVQGSCERQPLGGPCDDSNDCEHGACFQSSCVCLPSGTSGCTDDLDCCSGHCTITATSLTCD